MKHILVGLLIVCVLFFIAAGCKKQAEEAVSKTGTVEVESVDKVEPVKEADVAEETEEEEEVQAPVPEKPTDTVLRTLYVAPDGKGTNEGTREAPLSLKKAGKMARAGDLVLLMDGTYKQRLMVAHSGEEGKPIIFRAENRHKAILTETGEAIDIAKKSYIVIDGLILRKVKRAIVTLDPDDVPSLKAIGPQHLTHHITITNCRFEDIKAPQGCRLQLAGDRFRITNNYFKGAGDLVRLVMGRYHLIENNEFRDARHACLALVGVEYSVVRNNTFYNPTMKLLELNSRRRPPEKGRPLRHLVIENNWFNYTAPYKGKGSEASAIQFNGHHVIVRRNVFQHCQLGIYWYYSHNDPTYEASWNKDNRIIHNVFFENGHAGADHYCGPAMVEGGGGESERWGNHVIANNIFFANHHYPGRKINEFPETLQIVFMYGWSKGTGGSPRYFHFFGNSFMCKDPGEAVIGEMIYGNPRQKLTYTVGEFENAFPANAWDNLNVNPLFVDASNSNFHLTGGSPCIDAAKPLTKTKTAGKGREIEVEDALYFTDGFGVVAPDVLRIGNKRVWIERIDYDAHVLTVNRSIVWKAGDPVTLDYVGKGPDIGAFEFRED